MAQTFVAVRACLARPGEPMDGEPEVCLKRLRGELAADATQRAHFADEARTLARLCHPHIAALLDVGPDHLVTELVDGVDLRRLLAFLAGRSERLAEPFVVRVARDLAGALAHAHARGVVHRDVTPANVVVGRDGRVVLVDFGIARSDAQKQRTRTGLVKGKAPYMAPEQALGAPIDARTDLFALGVMLFEMLCGARPHDGASDLETLRRAMRAERRGWGPHPPAEALRALVERLLAPDPRDRPRSADDVERALEALPCGAREGLGAWARAALDAPPPRTRRGVDATRPHRTPRSETVTFAEEEIPTREDPALLPAEEPCVGGPRAQDDWEGSAGPDVIDVRTDEAHVVTPEPEPERDRGAPEERTAITERLPWEEPPCTSPRRAGLTPAGAIALGVMIGGSAGALAAALWHLAP
jgi:serine/threonine protein kinase